MSLSLLPAGQWPSASPPAVSPPPPLAGQWPSAPPPPAVHPSPPPAGQWPSTPPPAASPPPPAGQWPSAPPPPAVRHPPPTIPQLSHPTLTSGLVLSPASELFPRKLVDKVNSGQFVDMRELLADNISLLHQLEAIQGYPALHTFGAARPPAGQWPSAPPPPAVHPSPPPAGQWPSAPPPPAVYPSPPPAGQWPSAPPPPAVSPPPPAGQWPSTPPPAASPPPPAGQWPSAPPPPAVHHPSPPAGQWPSALRPASYHRQSHSPSPLPRTNHHSTSSMGSSSSGACYYAPSPDSSKLSGKQMSLSKEELVDMPFYQFKKILDDPTVDQNEKEYVKSIRKRGKNKVAAKNCRQKKIEVVMGLQEVVDKMKEQKKRLDMKCQGLEQEINQLKQRCSSFR